MERVNREFVPNKERVILPGWESFSYSVTPIDAFCTAENCDTDFDSLSGLPLVYTSLALRYFLSHHDLQHNINDDHIHIQNVILSGTKSFQKDVDFLFSGSSFEKLTVPYCVKRQEVRDRGQMPEYTGPDVDMMIVLKFMQVGDKGEGFQLELDYTNCHPGFARVRVLTPNARGPFKTETVTEDGETKSYLQRGNVIGYLSEQFAANLDPGDEVESHGPAITRKERWSSKDILWAMEHEMDLVFTIICPKWPQVAQEWVDRRRDGVWPSRETIETIVSNGCHMVAIDHALSAQKGYEWRMSFSAGEKRLAASLSIQQRKCYVLFKLLQKHHLSTPKVLCSYHLKNILFWTCEEISPDTWTETNTFYLLLDLLDTLGEWLYTHNIPNFFIPANNMISHIPAEDVNVIHQRVLWIRRNTYKALLECDQKLQFDFSPSRPLQEIFDPFVKITEGCPLPSLPGREKSMEIPLAIAVSLVKLGQVYLSDGFGYYQRAYTAFADAWSILLHKLSEPDIHCVTVEKILFILIASLGAGDIDHIAAFYDHALIRLHEESESREIHVPMMVVDSRYTLETLLRFYQSGLCRHSDTLKGEPPADYGMTPDEFQEFIFNAMMGQIPQEPSDDVHAKRKHVHGLVQGMQLSGMLEGSVYFIPAYNWVNALYTGGFCREALAVLRNMVWACGFQPHIPLSLDLKNMNPQFLPPEIRRTLDNNSSLSTSAKAYLYFMLFRCYLQVKLAATRQLSTNISICNGPIDCIPENEDKAATDACGSFVHNKGNKEMTANSNSNTESKESLLRCEETSCGPTREKEKENRNLEAANDDCEKDNKEMPSHSKTDLTEPLLGKEGTLYASQKREEGVENAGLWGNSDEQEKDNAVPSGSKTKHDEPKNYNETKDPGNICRNDNSKEEEHQEEAPRESGCPCPLTTFCSYLFCCGQSSEKTSVESIESTDQQDVNITDLDVNAMLLEFDEVCKTIHNESRACSLYMLANTVTELQRNGVDFTIKANPSEIYTMADEIIAEHNLQLNLESLRTE